jgi:hypothetical protein
MTSLAAHAPRRATAQAANAAVPAWDGSGATFRVEEAPWGFRVRPRAGWRPLRLLGQAAALVTGTAAAATAASLAGPVLWGPRDVAWDVRLVLAALLAAAALLLLRWATRGSLTETEVDCDRAEVRQVVRSLVGWRTRLAAQGFGAVAGLRLERGERGLEVLVLDAVGGRTLAVAAGTRATLAPLRRRLERDLMPRSQETALGAPARGAAPPRVPSGPARPTLRAA